MRFLFELENVEIVEQINIYLGTREIIRIDLNEVNLKSWMIDQSGFELTIHFYNVAFQKVPRVILNNFEIFRIKLNEYQLEKFRLEKSKIHEFIYLMIKERKNLTYYLKIFVPSTSTKQIREYIKQNKLEKQIDLNKFC